MPNRRRIRQVNVMIVNKCSNMWMGERNRGCLGPGKVLGGAKKWGS
jgi:hypothetical protein